MAGENIETAVMFADVTDSTKLYETLGDAVANRVITQAIDLMGTLTKQHDGHVIKTIGDELMCRFDTADDCCRTAKAIHEQLGSGLAGEDVLISVNIGFEYGPAILMEDGDVFGDAVNVAARMMDIAGSQQIITTEETVKHLSQALVDSTRLFDKTSVKGKAGKLTIYQVIWENENLTKLAFSGAAGEDESHILQLFLKGQKVEVASQDQKTFIIGRDIKSDLVVDAKLASRTHARITFRRNKFLLEDKSSNGTYVRTDDGENIYLRRQELMLWGSGHIALGQEVQDDDENVIKFVCLS
jgi:adenylate cyclase